MTTPFVFITTHKVRPGSLDALKALTRDYTAFLDEHDARLVAHSAFLNEDETELSLVQVHPDAASAEHHMRIVEPSIAAAAELTEPVAITVYGRPGPAVQATLDHLGGAGVPVTVRDGDLGGFTRCTP
jgi:hypothetical protein